MSSLRVKTPKYLNDIKTEKLLLRYYNLSKAAEYVEFDFALTRWTSPYCLSLMLIWMRELSTSAESTVVFKCPAHSVEGEANPEGASIQSFLGLWGYWSAMEKLGIKVIANEAERTLRRPLTDFSDKCVPFHFFDSVEFLKKFIADFDLKRALSEVAGSSCYIGDIGSAGVRSIILYELGKNLMEHGQGKAAHITIGVTPLVKGKTTSELQKKLYERSEAVPKYAQGFYSALDNRRCLEIVISDQGPGIQDKLRGPYSRDPILKHPMVSPEGHELIKYAFMMHSTSKDDSWYFDVDTGRTPEHYKPPRGLYFVKNIARRNNALLTCRSGNSLIAYDFLSQERGVYYTNASDPRLATMAPLAGTQIRVLIPLPERPRSIQIPASIRFGVKSDQVDTVWVDLVAYCDVASGTKFDSRAAVQAIHKLANDTRKNMLILIDFLNVHPQKEYLYPVISEIQHLSLANHKFLLVNCSDALFDIEAMAAREDSQEEPIIHDARIDWQKKRPILLCHREANGLKLSLVGIPSNLQPSIEEITAQLLRGDTVPNEQVPQYLDHIAVSAGQGKAQLAIAPEKILQCVATYNKQRLRDTINNPVNRICHEGKFLFPSLVYSGRFYEIGAAFENEGVTNRLAETLLDTIGACNSGLIQILSVSSIGAQLGELIAKCLRGQCKVKHVNSLSPDIATSALLDFDRRQEVTLLVDVIATGRSIERTLVVCENFGLKIVKVVAVVDIRPMVVREAQIVLTSRQYDIAAIVRTPTPLFTENRPLSWAWSDIQRVDPDSWRLLKPAESPEELWSTESFVKAAIWESRAVTDGHYYAKSTNKHFAFFFVTAEICKNFGDDIASKVEANVKQFVSANSKELVRVTHVFVPKANLGIQYFAQSLAQRLGAPVVQIHTEPSLVDWERNEPIDCAVAIDSALSTGNTIWDVLDIISDRGAKGIYVCVIMNRATAKTSKRLGAVRLYNSAITAFKNVVELPIHAFESATSCPICEKLETLRETRRLFRSPDYDRVVDRVRSIMEPISIEAIDVEQLKLTDEAALKSMEGRVLIRAKIQKAKDNDSQAWQQILSLCDQPNLHQDDVRSLIEVLYTERAHFSRDKQLFPPEFRRKLFLVCIELLKIGDGSIHEPLAVAVSFEPSLLLERIAEIVRVLACASESIYLLYMELASQRLTTGDEYLANALMQISSALKELEAEPNAGGDLFDLIFAAERALTLLGIDKARAVEMANRRVWLFRELYRAINDKRPTELHDHARELWTFLAGISFEKASNILDKFYFGADGFEHFALKQLLPNLLSLCEEWAPLVKSRYGYIWDQLAKDLQLLHEGVMRVRMSLNKGGFGAKDFEDFWDNKSLAEARARIRDNVIDPGGELRSFLTQRFCKPVTVMEQVLSNCQAAYQQEAISLVREYESANSVEVFCAEDTLRSILSNVCGNAIKYAFPGQQGYMFKKVIATMGIQDGKYVITCM